MQEAISQKTQEFARRGFRTLGVACKEDDDEWKFLGLLPMFDPPRSDTAQTIAEAGDLGVRVKMLTGDAVAIAKETCRQLALGTNVYDSERLITGNMSGSDIHDFVESADGFAEVTPEHKYQVVEMLQNRRHLTAMTGDGVNDAPSLKRADCGIAVQGASDAARSAADVVFLDEGLSTIITAIKVARQIFHRMKAYIVYRIALCLHLEIYLTLSMIILNETIRADLIVFIALFADLGTIAIAYDNAPYARAPVEWQLPKIWVISTVLGMLLAGATWILRATMFLDNGGIIQNWGSVQEILFLEVSLTENWLIFVTRGYETWPSWQLVGAILGIDILASIFALFGWISGPDPHNGHTDIVTVVKVWAYSFGVTIVLALVYFLLSQITFLDKLGRKMRGEKNEKHEDFLTNLRRLTLVHEMSGSEDVFRFEQGRGSSRPHFCFFALTHVDVGYIHVTEFAHTPTRALSLAVMNNGDPVLIPIACRFVASDQWLTVQLDTSWKISEVKKYILTKVYNRSVADNEHEPSRGRPVSPITFASARDSFESSTLMGSLEDDLNADLDHHFFTESARQPRVRHPPTQRVTSPSVPELPTEQPPAAAAAPEAEPGFPPRHYPMLAFSTGQLLEDDFSLAWYRLRPHELLELHPPGTIVRLPREVMLDYVKPYLELDVRALRVVVNNSDKDKDKDSHALGPSCAPPQLPPSSLPLPLDASSSSLSSPTKLRKSRDAAGESRGPSAAAAGAGGGVGGAGGGCGGSPAGAQSMRKRRKTKLEWRDRYLVIRQGMLSLFKSRTDLTPVHTCSLATLTTLRGQEEVVHTTTTAARSPHVVCAKFHVEACAPGSPDLPSSSLPMTEQWNDPWSGGTIAPALEIDGNLWRRPESKEDLKQQRRSVVEGCERSRGNSVPKEDLLDSRTQDSKAESLRYDLNVGDGTQGIWLVLDTLNEFGYSNLLRVLHRSSPDTINSSLVPSYLLPDSSLPSPSSPSSQLSSYTGTPRGSTCAYPEWRIEVSRRAQKTGLGDVTDAMGWILWGGPPLEPPTSKRSGTELRKKSSQLPTDDSGPHPEPFDLDVDDGGNDEDFELEWDSWAMDLTRQALASASNSIAVTVTEPVPIHPHYPHRIRPTASSSTFSSVSLSDHGPPSSLGRRPSDILLGANMRLLSKDSPALLTAPSVLPFQSTGVTTSTVSVGNVVRTRSLISVDGGRGRGVPRAMEVLSEDISGSIGGGGSGGGGRSTGRSRSGRQKRKCEETLRGALASSAPSPSLAGPTANTITSTVTVHESGGTPSPTLPYHVSPFVEGSPGLAVGVSTSPPSSAAAALAAAAGGGMSETASLASGITTVTTTTTIQLLPRRPSASGDMLNEEAGSSSQKRGDKVGKGKGRDKGKDKEKEKEAKSPSRRMAFSPERLVSKLDSALDFVTG